MRAKAASSLFPLGIDSFYHRNSISHDKATRDRVKLPRLAKYILSLVKLSADMRVAKDQIQFLNKYIYSIYTTYIKSKQITNSNGYWNLTIQMRHLHVLRIYLDSLCIQKRTSCFFLHSVIARNMILFRIRHFSFLHLMSLALRAMQWSWILYVVASHRIFIYECMEIKRGMPWNMEQAY